MDLSFSKEEVAFRDEVRTFFKENVPASTRAKLQEGRHLSKQEMIDWWRILNKKGWGVSHWPKEYGGTGWTSVQHYIFNEELQMAPAPSIQWTRGREPLIVDDTLAVVGTANLDVRSLKLSDFAERFI